MVTITIIYVNGTQICKLEALDNTPLYCFCFWSVSRDFTKSYMNEISLRGTVYDFSTGYCLIGTENILDIHEYSMKKHNIK